jgi:hypothetical protein
LFCLTYELIAKRFLRVKNHKKINTKQKNQKTNLKDPDLLGLFIPITPKEISITSQKKRKNLKEKHRIKPVISEIIILHYSMVYRLKFNIRQNFNL